MAFIFGATDLRYLDSHRVARLSTIDQDGFPHLVPVCFVRINNTIYITVDQKPKKTNRLSRLKNIEKNPSVALLVDQYDEDWSRLSWLMLRGEANILTSGMEYNTAQTQLKQKYKQYKPMTLTTLPLIAIQVIKVNSWQASP